MERDFNNYPPYLDFSMSGQNDLNDMYRDQMFNPIMQYEQAYSYYKYLCMQMDYKLKCKEYERICGNNKNNMELNIYLSYEEDDEKKKLQPILRSSYEFKRGYDTRGTKRYKVYYQVNCYFCL